MANILYAFAAALFLLAAGPASAAGAAFDTARIEQLAGAQGKLNPDGDVFKVSLPRDDLRITIGGTSIPPALGLTSWAAFSKAGDRDLVMGDVVVTETTANPALDAALAQGLEVTALHNHFFGDSPRVMFMHVSGMGDEAQLAKAVGAVFAASRKAAPLPSAGRIEPGKGSLDAAALDKILGEHGEISQGIYKATIGRSTAMTGHKAGKDMGVNTWAAFAGSNDAALVDGDFAMHEDEVQAVLKALRRAGIAVVALHNHMLGETPRIMFLHYWGAGRAADLAKGVKAALDVTRSR